MIAKQNEKFIRQPALRLFAAELAESKQTIIEHVEGRDFDSRQQLTPTGVKVKRVLMMGALVEVDNVGTSGEYLRGRIVDPTGAFNVYAGHYQPEALLSLSNLAVPCFVAVVGKTNAYKPDEETTIVSIRPETIVEIDAKTRDHWVKETVAKTMERVEKSQIPEAEKEKYRQMCKGALTKLVHMPQETSVPLHETPEIPTPHQEENIPDRPTIEQPTVKDKQPDDTELKERIFYLMMEASSKVPQKVVSYTELANIAKKIHGIEEDTAILKEEKPSPSLPASASEKHTEHESMTSTDALSIREHKDEEPKDEILITSRASSAEELPKPENEISKTLQIKESKESKTKPSDSIKARIRKKKIKREPVNNSQKTLFTEA